MHQEIIVLIIVLAACLYAGIRLINLFRMQKKGDQNLSCSPVCGSCFHKDLSEKTNLPRSRTNLSSE